MKVTEIDEANKTISGTFVCKIKRTVPEEKEVIIKDGSFTKITYTTEPGSNPENEFSAKVDGANFPASTAGGVQAFGKLTLNFAKSNADAIGITVPDDISTGTYTLGRHVYLVRRGLFDVINYLSGGLRYAEDHGAQHDDG